MIRFFQTIKRGDFILAREPGGKWSLDEIRSISEELDIIHVVDPFMGRPLYGKILYYRLHGIGGWRYHYPDQDLQKLLEISFPEKTVYAMFNNISMFDDARRFTDIAIKR